MIIDSLSTFLTFEGDFDLVGDCKSTVLASLLAYFLGFGLWRFGRIRSDIAGGNISVSARA